MLLDKTGIHFCISVFRLLYLWTMNHFLVCLFGVIGNDTCKYRKPTRGWMSPSVNKARNMVWTSNYWRQVTWTNEKLHWRMYVTSHQLINIEYKRKMLTILIVLLSAVLFSSVGFCCFSSRLSGALSRLHLGVPYKLVRYPECEIKL